MSISHPRLGLPVIRDRLAGSRSHVICVRRRGSRSSLGVEGLHHDPALLDQRGDASGALRT
jgi:hypothetical protein